MLNLISESDLLAFVLAALAVPIAMLAGVLIMSWFRSRSYRLQQEADFQSAAGRDGVPELAKDSASAKQLTALSSFFADDHEASIRFQNKYKTAITCSSAAILFGFIASALSLTVFEQYRFFKLFAALVDVFALSYVYHEFVTGKLRNRQWLLARTKTELVRQNTFLAILFPGTEDSTAKGDMTTKFSIESSMIEKMLKGKNASDDLGEVVREFWAKKRQTTYDSCTKAAGFSNDAVLMYVHKRVIRQLTWFMSTRMRLQRGNETVTGILGALYFLAFVFALVEAIMVLEIVSVALLPISEHVVSFLSLMATGISAATTALYASKNERSLIHRYRLQERRIQDWLRDFRTHFLTRYAATSFDAAFAAALCGKLLDFEDIMTDELVDWIHISRHDSIELAP